MMNKLYQRIDFAKKCKVFILMTILFFWGCGKKNSNTITNPVLHKPCFVNGWASMNGGTIGGGNVAPTVVTNYTSLKVALENSNVKVVQVDGRIEIPSGGKIVIQNQQSKTIFGSPGAILSTSDQSSSLSGILYVKQSSNLIFRNLIFDGAGAYDVDGNDNLTIENSTNVWIDHCDFRDGLDGNLDIKSSSNYITVSYCKFSYIKPPRTGGPGGSNDHRFSNLIGSSDATITDRGNLNITFAYCWWAQGCVARMPRVRFGKVHVLNSYFNSTTSSSCIQAGLDANLLIEGNVFEMVKNAVDLMANNAIAVELRNNNFISTTGNMAGNGIAAFVPPYTYTALPVSDVKAKILANTGAVLSGNTCVSF